MDARAVTSRSLKDAIQPKVETPIKHGFAYKISIGPLTGIVGIVAKLLAIPAVVKAIRDRKLETIEIKAGEKYTRREVAARIGNNELTAANEKFVNTILPSMEKGDMNAFIDSAIEFSKGSDAERVVAQNYIFAALEMSIDDMERAETQVQEWTRAIQVKDNFYDQKRDKIDGDSSLGGFAKIGAFNLLTRQKANDQSYQRLQENLSEAYGNGFNALNHLLVLRNRLDDINNVLNASSKNKDVTKDAQSIRDRFTSFANDFDRANAAVQAIEPESQESELGTTQEDQ